MSSRGRGRGRAEPFSTIMDRMERMMTGMMETLQQRQNAPVEQEDQLAEDNQNQLPSFVKVLDASLIAEKGVEEMERSKDWRKKRQGFEGKEGATSGSTSKRPNIGGDKSTTPEGNIPSTCLTCGKAHWGMCRLITGKCFRCGQEGHQVRNCPKPSKNVTTTSASSTPSVAQKSSARPEEKPESSKSATRQGRVFALVSGDTKNAESVVSENMERQAPYADHTVNPYAAAQMQQLALQRMQQNAGISNFSGRPESFIAEKEHINMLSKEEQRQWDKNAPRVSNPLSSHPYSEGHGDNAARSLYEGQMPDPKVDLVKQLNKESGFQTHEQDMEIGYEDKPSTLTFEGLEQRFLDEIMKLAKEQSDAEDDENAKHREKIIEINTRYQEKLSSVRAQQAKRREEFLVKEAQARLHQYQQPGMNHYPTNAGPIDPRGFGGSAAAAAEAHRAYAPGQFESYRERTPFLGGGRNQGTEARVPIPEGRVYNNTGARY